jgi:hypothetical protein
MHVQLLKRCCLINLLDRSVQSHSTVHLIREVKNDRQGYFQFFRLQAQFNQVVHALILGVIGLAPERN